MMVYIIVLNWNGINDTLNCLESLTALNGKQFKIVICDNGSVDNSICLIKEWYENNISCQYVSECEFLVLPHSKASEIKTIDSKAGIFIIDIGENLGFAGGNNIGVNFALNQLDMQYIWLLNNDTVVQPDTLEHMLQVFKNDERVGVCGSKLIYFDDRTKVQGLGGVFNSWFCTSRHYGAFDNSCKKYDDRIVSSQIDYVIGASMLISKRLVSDIGGLCEDYFLYYEEIDYCIRAQNKGYYIYVATESVVYHKEGASTSKIERGIIADYYAIRNRLSIAKKFFPLKYPVVYLSTFIALFNRIKRKEYVKASNILKILTYRKIENER
jgi:GT2 family glycosyltransferase